ncbi:MAG: hypothetical protein KGR26_07160, partial [Cyanobacteria bacterium REEB65]|nr:hypothetical protein [Cyanobacteria bacterium REEB65]
DEAQHELLLLQDRHKAAIDQAMRIPCGDCGAMLPPSRAGRPWCLCGWNARTPPVPGRRVFLHDVFAYAANRGVSVVFRQRGDDFVAAKGKLSVQGLGGKVRPVEPRLALPLQERLPVIVSDELQPLSRDAGPENLFRIRPLGDPYGGRLLTWRQLVAHVSERDGHDVSRRDADASLGAILMAYGRMETESYQRILEAKVRTETIGQAILRSGALTMQELLEGVLGRELLGPQPVRSLPNRLGARLVAAGHLTRQHLRHALFLQSQIDRLLGELLLEAKFVDPRALEAALRQQPPPSRELPLMDDLGEVLVAHRQLSRSQLLASRDELARMGSGSLADWIRDRRIAPQAEVERIVRWREQKLGLIANRVLRLGTLLVSQRVVVPEAIGQALMLQVDQQLPLGELLVETGALTPEQLANALEEQTRRRNRQAWEGLDLGPSARPARSAPTRLAPLERAKTRALTRSLSEMAVATSAPRPASAGSTRRRRPRRRRSPLFLPLALLGALLLGLVFHRGLHISFLRLIRWP